MLFVQGQNGPIRRVSLWGWAGRGGLSASVQWNVASRKEDLLWCGVERKSLRKLCGTIYAVRPCAEQLRAEIENFGVRSNTNRCKTEVSVPCRPS